MLVGLLVAEAGLQEISGASEGVKGQFLAAKCLSLVSGLNTELEGDLAKPSRLEKAKT